MLQSSVDIGTDDERAFRTHSQLKPQHKELNMTHSQAFTHVSPSNQDIKNKPFVNA